MTFVTRFAPSPTGPLHLGHAYSALTAFDLASAANGEFFLRIEDIDQSRARSSWEQQIYEDLHWLGLRWPTPVMRQSDRMARYEDVLRDLHARGLLYACHCSRRDIAAAASAPQEGAPLLGPDGIVYPGTCRDTPHLPFDPSSAYRLDLAAAFDQISDNLCFEEADHGPDGQIGTITVTRADMLRDIGDPVLARRDMGTSYHLSVVVDDADQGITDVVRGRDLFEATAIHVVLQRLLDLPTPRYHHHDLVRDPAGKRLAKRDDARAIALLRDEGASAADIRKMVGL
ncbi:tRNA glutamyl-Q(34) synthetase GluQRS [Sulfitobacter sp. S190]|uniref:tRNA glutamyl-Q(34) synthetase GluQRS n=1 Tax=Sulfitobacter sp. S190 TaxID=2867022 RepID=UPI0021A76AEE|nr:tRNA glutamyl-Q(34) synthetase GluQRS [Sulfitobacter sp. S190]UWR20874.1 tRNA glutamyl-Q(34) synthetase GluQRS [Sulfitobacter sp. S190]